MASAPAGHLATVTPDGQPHIVVITFAVTEESVVTAIDHKPKTTHRLQRLANIEANPMASFLVDHYDDDWEQLWWVRIDGAASIHERGESRRRAVEALSSKYRQYQRTPPGGPVIAIARDRVSHWSSKG